MKIALIDPSLFTWPYDKALADALIAQGHDVTFYTKYLSQGEQGKGTPYLKEIFYPGFEKKWMASLPRAIFLGLKGVSHFFSLIHLWLELRREKPDAIHFQWAPLPVVDSLFVDCFRKLATVVLTVHDSSPFNNNPRSKLQSMGAIEIMQKYDHLIVHTEKARDALKKYGLPEAKIKRIDHGVLGATLPEVPPASEDAQKSVTILLFGHLKPYKGADILIKALGHMPADVRKKSKVRIVGKPQMETKPLFDLAKNLGVEENIQWDLRFIEEAEVGAVFAESDITAMPYREIDASGVLMVSLALGRPIVASRIGLFAEILEDGAHGYLTPLEDDKALAVALEKLIMDASLRQSMGQNVEKLGRSIPSWKDIALKTTMLYQREKRQAA